ncbi:hypothetical protein DFH94DRAFT_633087 [Russula ochroleuca]|uniref:SET domain-containing protein n=1 Tax=Russula ochroleuca TaxID=152965 RepID=A0A9P5MTZ6_9AGAM|nr:hypothetical protein DFH94DRAFT_633087 [Russula ochroleuca]
MTLTDSGLTDCHERRWNALLEWLQGHGMMVDEDHLPVRPKNVAGARLGLFAIVDIPPRTPILTLPSKAKINMATLGHYPYSKRLTATQLISLHLLLYKPAPGCESDDPHFAPYISILPRDFGDHPLTWAVHRTLGAGSREEHSLLRLLPPSVLSDLLLLERRFWKDWEAVLLYLDDLPDLSSPRRRPRTQSELILDFVWAWLNVNTRCLYDDLGLGKDNNMSLCPVFDFANHAWMQPTMEPVRAAGSEIWRPGRCSPGGDGNTDLVCVSCERGIVRDQEVTLSYGWHSNRTLFVEYGFANAITSEELMSGVYPGQVNVQDIVTTWLDCRGELGTFVKGTLEAEGYWGDWTIHCSPLPTQASFRLITALRLYHSFPEGAGVWSEEETTAASRRWRDTILGHEEVVSEENEKACEESIGEICEVVIKRAERGIEAVKEDMRMESEVSEWFQDVLVAVDFLWFEERAVAKAMLIA